MAYTPNEWGVGNLITASKMNKIERQLVANTSDLDDIRNGVTVPTYEEFETLRDDVAAEYDDTKTYAVGDYVIYNTQLYKCKTAITSAETWTAAHWTEAQVGDEVASLKSALNYAVETIPGYVKVDIYGDVTWTDGYVTELGVVYNGGTTYYYTDKIPVSEGDIISIDTTGGKTLRYATAYNGDNVVDDVGATYFGSYTVPEGVDGVIITLQKSYGVIPLYLEHANTTYKNILSDDVAENTDKLSQITVSNEYEKESVEKITPTFTSGYVDTNGAPHTSESYKYTQKITVSAGQSISLDVSEGSKNFRFLCAYAGDNPISASGVSSDSDTYVVPSGITGVVLTCYASATVDHVLIADTITYVATNIIRMPLGFMTKKGSLNDGDSLTLPVHNVKTFNRFVFDARITAFNSIKIEKNTHSFEVTSTSLKLVGYGSTPSVTVPHGLNISDTISVLIENNEDEKTSLIRISSGGNEFSYTTPFEYNVGRGAYVVKSDGSTLTECTVSWTAKTVNSNIWIFGDSYISLYNTRWTYYLVRDGFADNCLLNGFSGENSQDAVVALKNLLNITVPKILVWCIGMNNPDSASEINASWVSGYETVKNLQKRYGFELILYTTPTTPRINNEYKNAVIRSSGFRYIDADKAVRIADSPEWISGALATDGVHPTEIGAKIIYYKVLADLPEVMSMD